MPTKAPLYLPFSKPTLISFTIPSIRYQWRALLYVGNRHRGAYYRMCKPRVTAEGRKLLLNRGQEFLQLHAPGMLNGRIQSQNMAMASKSQEIWHS